MGAAGRHQKANGFVCMTPFSCQLDPNLYRSGTGSHVFFSCSGDLIKPLLSVSPVPLVGCQYLPSAIPQMRLRLVRADSTTLPYLQTSGCSRSECGAKLCFKQLPRNANVAHATLRRAAHLCWEPVSHILNLLAEVARFRRGASICQSLEG